MPRRTFLRYKKADELDEQVIQHYLLAFAPENLYKHPHHFPSLCSQALFEDDHPLALEIGCGSGEQLCALALEHPKANFVGIDIAGKSLTKAVEQAFSAHLENIRFIHADFQQMYSLLVPNALNAVYLHFPDPHMKLKHRHKRIFNQVFLDHISLALQPGSILSVMTDVAPFFLDMLALAEQDERFVNSHEESYLIGFEEGVKSHFQRVWEGYHETVYRFEMRKK